MRQDPWTVAAALMFAAALLATPAPGGAAGPPADPAAAPVPIPVRLADGATWSYTSDHTVRKLRGGPAETTSHRYEVTRQLTWQARGDGGRLHVRPMTARMIEGAPAGAAAPDLDFPFVLEVDAGLVPSAFADPATVTRAAERLFSRDAGTRAALPRLEARVPQLVTTLAWVMAAQDLLLLAAPQGRTYTPGRPIVVQEELENPLGGPRFHVRDVYSLEEVDRLRGVATVSVRREPDPRSLRASVAGVARAMSSGRGERDGPGMAEGVERSLKSLRLELEQSCRYDLDLATGLTLQAVCTKRSLLQVGERRTESEDRWTIRQVPPRPPGAPY